jgi:hypothetical protein
MQRTSQNLKEDVVKNDFGVGAQPLVSIEPEHIIIDHDGSKSIILKEDFPKAFDSQTPSMTTNPIHLEYSFLSKCKTKRRILLCSQ